MVFDGKTLNYIQGNTHEGMKWVIRDEVTNIGTDLTGATVNVLVQSVDGSDTIINREATIVDATAGICKLVPVAGEMDTPGVYKVQLHIVFADTTEVYIQNMFINIISALS